jgi:hypothetical protein
MKNLKTQNRAANMTLVPLMMMAQVAWRRSLMLVVLLILAKSLKFSQVVDHSVLLRCVDQMAFSHTSHQRVETDSQTCFLSSLPA